MPDLPSDLPLRQACKSWGSQVSVVTLFLFPVQAFLYGPKYPFPLYLHQLIWSKDMNSFQALLDLALTERGLKPLGWQTAPILHCNFMQITSWQLPVHCCALVCQPISGLGIPQEMLTHLPYLFD